MSDDRLKNYHCILIIFLQYTDLTVRLAKPFVTVVTTAWSSHLQNQKNSLSPHLLCLTLQKTSESVVMTKTTFITVFEN